MRSLAVLLTIGVIALAGWGYLANEDANVAAQARLKDSTVSVKGLAYTEPEKVDVVQPEAPALVDDGPQAPEQPAEAVGFEVEKAEDVAKETTAAPVEAQEGAVAPTEELVCYQMGPMKEANLPRLNEDLQKHNLVSKVFIEPVETPNDYRVCVGPLGDDEEQAREVKLFQDKGLSLAQAFNDERGERFVSLRHFSTEWEAHDWALRAGQRLGLTRLAIKKATVDMTPTVRLLFHNLTQEEGKVVEKLGETFNENVEVCR